MHILLYIIAGLTALGTFVIVGNLFPHDYVLEIRNPELYKSMRWTARIWIYSGLISAALLATIARICHLLEILVQQGRRTDHPPVKKRRDEKISHETALEITETDTGQFMVDGRTFESFSDAEAYRHNLTKSPLNGEERYKEYEILENPDGTYGIYKEGTRVPGSLSYSSLQTARDFLDHFG